MKKLSILLTICVVLLISSCAPGPVGVWNYSVTGTPQGDFKGVMTISKTETGYAAKMDGLGATIPFDKFNYNKSTKKTDGSFDFQGTPIDYAATFSKDQLKGSVSAAGMDWPFAATRKK